MRPPMNQYSVIITILFLFSCARQPISSKNQAMRQFTKTLSLSDDLEIQEFKEGLEKHIKILMKRPNKNLIFGPKIIKARDYAWSLNQLTTFKDKNNLLKFLEDNFIFMEVFGKSKWGEILLTSYYEPMYPARKQPSELYNQPIYQIPPDLVELDMDKFGRAELGNFNSTRSKMGGRIRSGPGQVPRVVPFYSRQEIDQKNKLKGQNLELYYLDPIHSFFLQIQGSGILKLEDGTIIRVGYAAQNGWKYESIGKHLFHIIPKEEMSLQRIEKYLRSLSKEDLYEFLNINPSYVFFRVLEGRGLTTFGNEVISGRTLAIDSSLFPLGALGYLKFKKPHYADKNVEVPTSYNEASRLVLAQDTGGAIKSAGRADLFWGQGEKSLRYAGTMRHDANLWFLFPKKDLYKANKSQLPVEEHFK